MHRRCSRWIFAAAFLSSISFAENLTLAPLKPGGVYALGERAGWQVSAPQGAAPREYSYAIKKNNLDVIKTGTLDLSKPAIIEATLNEPAMLYVDIDDGDPATELQAVGAAIAPAQLRPSVPKPRDFDRFWAEKIKRLQSVPANPVLTAKETSKADVEHFILKMNHIDNRHIHGQVAKPKREGKFPGLVILQWASPPYPLQPEWVTDRAAEGWLAVNIEPHDVLPDQPKEYYDALPQELKEYHKIGINDRDKNYFLYMYLAAYRAVDYLASRPDWDGKTIVAMGTSMGGQQTLCAAGLNPKVTALITHVPAGADTHGPLHGRRSGYPNWPTDDPEVLATSPYFDTVNCASRIKVPSLVSMGFIDVVTPPVGIFTAFNQLRGYKEAVPLMEAPHNHLATPEQQAPYEDRSREWLRTLAAGGDVAEPAYRASPRLDNNSRLVHEQLLVKKTQGQIDAYFLGDSITRRWGATDYPHLLANWNENFRGWNAANFGWGADKTQNILWRLEHGELDGVHPKVIVLMAGTNNVGSLTPIDEDRARIADIARGLETIIKVARKKAPRATILLTGIPPRNDNLAVMPTINGINARLAKLADGNKIRFININGQLANSKGELYEGMTDPDKLHLSLKAYQIWADALKPHLQELLGPRASVDQAPPPTGDPSAKR
jgi:cephalosporin-C deacetylase-like acetyl esterase/lysophospholipase L1-like esterase